MLTPSQVWLAIVRRRLAKIDRYFGSDCTAHFERHLARHPSQRAGGFRRRETDELAAARAAKVAGTRDGA